MAKAPDCYKKILSHVHFARVWARGLGLRGPSDGTDTLQCLSGQGTPESSEKGVVVFMS